MRVAERRYATDMRTAACVSIDEYLNSSYEPDCEYVDGELLERNVGEIDHGGLQLIIGWWLKSRAKQLGIYAFSDTRVQVSPTRFRVPDVVVSTYKPRERIFREPPFLCIEILSPEDRASRTQEKIDDYLRFGVAHVWLIDPRRKRAWSYARDGRHEAASVLTTSEPRIELPIADLFAELNEQTDFADED
jgi:Uma2 family endonuclease